MRSHTYTGNNNVDTFDFLAGYAPELTMIGFTATDCVGATVTVKPGDTIVISEGLITIMTPTTKTTKKKKAKTQ